MCNLTPSTPQLGTEEYIQYNMFLQWHYLEEQKKLKNWRLKSSESSIDFSKQNAKLICCNMQYKLCQICTFISGVNVGNSRYLSMEPTVIRVLKSRRGLTRGWRFYRKCSDNVDLYNTFLHRKLQSKSTKLYHIKIILVSNIWRIDKLESKHYFDLMKTTNYFSANLYLPFNSLVLITLVIIRLKKIR